MAQMGEDQGSVVEEMPLPALTDDVFKIILQRDKEARDFINRLRGKTPIPTIIKGKKTFKYMKTGPPIMNEKGVQYFKLCVHSIISLGMRSSNITDEEYKTKCLENAEVIIQKIESDGDEFDISATNRDTLLKEIDDLYAMSLSQSRRGTLLSLLKPTIERKEVYTPRREEKSKVRLPSFLGGR